MVKKSAKPAKAKTPKKAAKATPAKAKAKTKAKTTKARVNTDFLNELRSAARASAAKRLAK